MLGFRPLAALLALAPLLGASPALQEPKMGTTWYSDEVDVGFKVKAPRDWEFVPGSPLERNLIGKYAAGNGQFINMGREAFVMVQIFLVKFDRRPQANQKEERQFGDQKVEFTAKGLKDLDEWMERGIDEGTGWHVVEAKKPLKGALEGTFAIYEGRPNRGRVDSESPPVRAYAALFSLSPELDVALVGVGPGDKKKWRGFETAYQGFAKSIQRVELQASSGPQGKDPRSIKRAKLEAEVARSPGWSLHETPNYFILSCYDDKAFIEELKLRLEGIRQVYEKDYPPELSRKVKVRPKKASEDDEPGEEPDPDDPTPPDASPTTEPEEPDPQESIAAVDTIELGKVSVVRLCKNHEQYLQYGGPNGTSGYFSPIEQELVVYDAKADEGRDATWAVLNHEGFHQYTFAFFGNLAPHSWYNEGTGDYYAGFSFNVKSKKFKVEKNVGRQDNILMIREDYAPLRDFVQWDKAKYYGSGGIGRSGKELAGWACYAQGWSLIYFLREGSKAKGWQKEWGSILDTYTNTLLETGDLDKALEKAFEGVDWDAFEDSWRNFTI